MKALNRLITLSAVLILTGTSTALAGMSSSNNIEQVKKTAELQIRNLIEPVLDKYCRDECKLMTVNAQVDIAVPDETAPGFEDYDPKSSSVLAPALARAKIMIDEKVGPVSRGKIIEMIQQYLDTLEYPVKIETQITRFPQPIGSAEKVAELRDRVTKIFKGTVEDLFRQFCPDQCMLADYELQTELVNTEEAQYGSSGEFFEDAGVAIRLKRVSATILMDDTLLPEEQSNVLEMAKLKTNFLKNVSFSARVLKFPRPLAELRRAMEAQGFDVVGYGTSAAKRSSTDSKSTSNLRQLSSSTNSNQNTTNTATQNQLSSKSHNEESSKKDERYEKYEKIERVENGDAVQVELRKFKTFGLIFAGAVILLLLFLVAIAYRQDGKGFNIFHQLVRDADDEVAPEAEAAAIGAQPGSDRGSLIGKRYEIERLLEELMNVFAQHPKVAKQVFTRVLTEDGVEVTSEYIHIFGESVVIDMLRDPSLQADLNDLIEYHAKNPVQLSDDEKLDLLRKLQNRTVAGKLAVMGSRSSNLFDFLAEMDATQILEMVRNESLTVKSIILTQCDNQKRAAIYAQLDGDTRMKLLTELSRIDYLPRDYIYNVANALKRKRRENPRLNTESLPGSDVLVTLLERTGLDTQRSVIRNLELSNPESAHVVKSKLVSLETLRFMRDAQVLEVVLSLKHDELLVFLKGSPQEISSAVLSKAPKDLSVELEEELVNVNNVTRDMYQNVERKVINRMKLMANEGLISLVETNDRLLSDTKPATPPVPHVVGDGQTNTNIKKVAGW